MKVLAFIISLVALVTVGSAIAADLPYKDSDFGCISQGDADRYVRDFSIDVASFGGKELCDGTKDTKKLFNDLTLIEKAEFNPDIAHNFIRNNVRSNNYYDWLKRETRGVERGNDIPAATAYNRGGYFTMQDGWAALTTLGRVGTIIHEARHTEGYGHIRCTFGPYANASMPGCDSSYSYGGSHAVEMEYYVRAVLLSKNLHPAYRSMARLMAMGRSNFVFNQQILRKREGLVLVDAQTKSPWLLADNNFVERKAPLADVSGWALKRTSHGASFYSGTQAWALDLYSHWDEQFSIKDDYSYYKMFQVQRPNEPKNVVDTEELDVGNLRYFVALSADGRLGSYDFPNGQWFQSTAPVSNIAKLATMTADGKAGLFLVTKTGSILPFDLNTRKVGAPLSTQWPLDVVSFAKANSNTLALKNDGVVYSFGRSGLEKYPLLDGRTFTHMVNVPLYDAFEVAP